MLLIIPVLGPMTPANLIGTPYEIYRAFFAVACHDADNPPKSVPLIGPACGLHQGLR
jgi:hypothetical protein